MRDELELTLFGSPEVRLHGLLVTGFRSSKAQALLYYLVVTGRPHTRSTLAGLLWGNQPEAAARASLSKCLSNLHDLVGDAVLIERQTVAFNRNCPYHLDTELFAAGVDAPPTPETLQPLHAALALYRGDFLEGFYVRDAPDFEQWVLVQRAHYREAIVQGVYALARFADQHGDLPQAIAHTRRLLALEPWREEAHRQLMVLLARSGQRAAALAQFETCRRILDEELTVAPDAETVGVVEAIRSGEFDKVNGVQDQLVTLSPPHLVMNNLPIPPTPLIGRERELAEINHLLVNPECRLLTVVGPGGIGKTRLAIAASASQQAVFTHGVVFVALAALTSPEFIVVAIANTLGFAFSGATEPKIQLLNYLREKQLLLVLDNIEHLLDGVGLLTELLADNAILKLLVTSRARLNLQGEWAFELQGLPVPSSGQVEQPEAYGAVELFVANARRVRPGFALTEQNQAAIAYICRLVEGMPLGIELAAAWVHILSCQEIAEEIERNLDFLAVARRDVPERHRSLRAVFDHSWKLLSVEEQQVLARLAIFRGGFTREAASTIAGATLPLLSALVAKSLVQRIQTGRYDLHELVRQYAGQHLEASGQTREARDRSLAFFLRLAQQASLQIGRTQHLSAIEHFEHEADNLRAVLLWSLSSQQIEQGLQLTLAMVDFWEIGCNGPVIWLIPVPTQN